MFFCAEALSRCLVQGVKKRCTSLRENRRYANFEWSWVLESTDVLVSLLAAALRHQLCTAVFFSTHQLSVLYHQLSFNRRNT